mmetsp:Transcript_54539/g.173302  ORF Transcript_54539/g.173302 Transcript_54539/m.173302 type:complete len:210 (+) Transcript_54539:149-778(+)
MLVVVSEYAAPCALAELLEVLVAGLAVVARVDEAADTGLVTDLELGHAGPNLHDHARNLVPRHHGVDRAAPLAACLVDVRMADACVRDADADVAGSTLAAVKLPRRQLARLVVAGVREGVALPIGKLRGGVREGRDELGEGDLAIAVGVYALHHIIGRGVGVGGADVEVAETGSNLILGDAPVLVGVEAGEDGKLAGVRERLLGSDVAC